MEGEEERSEDQKSFSKASISKRMAIVVAGVMVNILFAIIVYFILMTTIKPIEDTFQNRIENSLHLTGEFVMSAGESIKQLVTGKIGVDQMTGPVGISEAVSKTKGIKEYIYMMSVISISLGVTNLLPIPALDGGKLLLLIIELIRKKPLKEQTEINIQLAGFSLLIALSIYVTYNDILKIF